jgi:hypothetical protein
MSVKHSKIASVCREYPRARPHPFKSASSKLDIDWIERSSGNFNKYIVCFYDFGHGEIEYFVGIRLAVVLGC